MVSPMVAVRRDAGGISKAVPCRWSWQRQVSGGVRRGWGRAVAGCR